MAISLPIKSPRQETRVLLGTFLWNLIITTKWVSANLLTSLNLIISKNLKNTAKVFSLELEVFAHTDGKRTMLVHL